MLTKSRTTPVIEQSPESLCTTMSLAKPKHLHNPFIVPMIDFVFFTCQQHMILQNTFLKHSGFYLLWTNSDQTVSSLTLISKVSDCEGHDEKPPLALPHTTMKCKVHSSKILQQ